MKLRIENELLKKGYLKRAISGKPQTKQKSQNITKILQAKFKACFSLIIYNLKNYALVYRDVIYFSLLMK